MKKFLIRFCVSLLLFLSLASSSFAYRVSPVVIELTAQRGKTDSDVLYLLGNVLGEEVLLYPVNIVLDRRGTYQFEKLEDWKYNGLGWMELYKATKVTEKVTERGKIIEIIGRHYKDKEVLILHEEKETYVAIVVEIPFNVKPGQYYAGIMIEPLSLRISRGVFDEKRVGVEQMTRIAVPITINVPGATPKLGGSVIETRAEIKEEEIKILSTFENTGNVLEYVTGKAEIVNKEDKRIYDVVTMKALNPQAEDGTGQIFPESLRDFEGVVKKPLTEGDYEIRVAFDYGIKSRKARARASFTVTEEISASQKELLTLVVDPELLQFEMKPGGLVIGGIEVVNQDFQDLHVDIYKQEGVNWLRIAKESVDLQASQPGQLVSKTIRYKIRIPRDERAERSTKILFKPERGKAVVIDVVIKEKETRK